MVAHVERKVNSFVKKSFSPHSEHATATTQTRILLRFEGGFDLIEGGIEGSFGVTSGAVIDAVEGRWGNGEELEHEGEEG